MPKYLRTATIEKAVKGFEAGGIYSLNSHMINEVELTPVQVVAEENTDQQELKKKTF